MSCRSAVLRLLAETADVGTQKILVAAKAAGVELALESAPKGSIPELRKGDVAVKYTGAILRYIGRIFENSDLHGNSFAESAQVDSWLDWSELELSKEVQKPEIEKAIGALEQHLATRTFLVGQRYTLADISVSCSLHHHATAGTVSASSLPRATKRWLGTCQNQDAFMATMPGSKGSAPSAPAVSSAAGGSASSAAVVPTTAEKPILAAYSSVGGGRTRVSRILLAQDGGKSLVGSIVSLCGWVRTKREAQKGAMLFVQLNDGSCVGSLQVVVCKGVTGFDQLNTGECGTGASIQCIGEVVESPGSGQAVEVLVKGDDPKHSVQRFGTVDAKEYPLAKKHHSLEYLRSIAHLRPRSNLMGAVSRTRSTLAHASHEFFRQNDFQYVHTPLITASDCEGAGEMFQVTTLLADMEKDKKTQLPLNKQKQIDYANDFFGKKAFLTVSGQLSVENYCCALSNVYTFGPTFRAENSHTTRHLAEFWMIEPEIAFATLEDNMQCAEDYIKFCVKFALEHRREDLEFFNKQIEQGLIDRLHNVIAEPFARMTYTEAVEVLQKEVAAGKVKFAAPVEWGEDLGSEMEKYLCEKINKKPTIVYNYPKTMKAFYMRLNDDDKTVGAMDILFPAIGEVVGGSAREERLDVLDRRLVEMDLDPKDYWWYRDLRRYGTVPHVGFGLGFERLIMLVTGVENIRDTIPYPRYPGHAEF